MRWYGVWVEWEGKRKRVEIQAHDPEDALYRARGFYVLFDADRILVSV